MDTASPAPAATEPERPAVRTSSRSGLADSTLGTRNLMTIAALAVVSMILLVPLNYVAPGAGAAPNGVLVGCSMMGLWVIPFLLPATIVRRPGAVVIGALLMGIMSVFTTPTGPAAIVGTLIGGLFIEVPLALLLYRKWTWWSFLISAAVFGLLNGSMYLSLLKATVGASFTGAVIVVSLVSALAGGGVAIVLTRLLNRAGVGIDHRTSGRA
ncbi:ECF transporter S component [Actinomyces sp. ZJ308]|uniref:ECF transporter S component n=1 Tax=Actinomyces sp. ZJ308 TaxID=2708342 RepID=UPI00141DB9D6|nr:ECF transporter S component [Actinomyces sp. ZJ308]